MNPLLYTDFYKVHHHRMYPEGTTMIYSNLTPRKSRMKGVNEVVVFGIQHFIKKYLLGKFNENFFYYHQTGDVTADGYNKMRAKERLIKEYTRHAGAGIDTKHIEDLFDLGYLPIEIKCLPEGIRCPIGVPMLTIKNTHPNFGWLTNYLETLISCQVWQPITSATIAYEYKKILSKYALETTGSAEFVQWQGHDFSMRGMSSVESAILSGMGHLTSFTGTDTIPAIYALEKSYCAKGLIGASVPATEHSVMCMGTKESEIDTFLRLLKLYPTGILSVVSDTWNLWDVLTKYLPKIKSEILARDGKLVIRPDSGNPVDIICGIEGAKKDGDKYIVFNPSKNSYDEISQEEAKGVIELLWETFGGTVNDRGYKVLDLHIGAIYGDSITLDRARNICERLKAKGFASTNIVLGIGSYTYQYNTRDTFGFAVKATAGEVETKWTKCYCGHTSRCECGPNEGSSYEKVTEFREIFKDPITDDGTKKSKKGLLQVYESTKDNGLMVKDQCTWGEESGGLLETVFKNGKLTKEVTLEEIRKRLEL